MASVFWHKSSFSRSTRGSPKRACRALGVHDLPLYAVARQPKISAQNPFAFWAENNDFSAQNPFAIWGGEQRFFCTKSVCHLGRGTTIFLHKIRLPFGRGTTIFLHKIRLPFWRRTTIFLHKIRLSKLTVRNRIKKRVEMLNPASPL